jgi:hypothetical protein
VDYIFEFKFCFETNFFASFEIPILRIRGDPDKNKSSVPGIVIWSLWHILVNFFFSIQYLVMMQQLKKMLLTPKVVKNDMNSYSV